MSRVTGFVRAVVHINGLGRSVGFCRRIFNLVRARHLRFSSFSLICLQSVRDNTRVRLA